MATRSAPRAPRLTAEQIAAEEKARKIRRTAARMAKDAAAKAAKTQAQTPTDEQIAAARAAEAQAEADRKARAEQDAQNARAALTIDARAVLGEDASDEAIDAYIAEQLAPANEDAEGKQRYDGPMLALVAARKSYVKAANGILCNGDALAIECGKHSREVVVMGLLHALAEAAILNGNPYGHLNAGQQSMNLRNKARGALKSGTLSMDAIVKNLGRAAEALKAK